MTVAYVAGPYRDRRGSFWVGKNIEAARQVAAEVWEYGWIAVSPHLCTAHFDGLVPDSHFLQGLLEVMRRCDVVVLVPGWERSEGTRLEVMEAIKAGMPVYEHPCLIEAVSPDVLSWAIQTWNDHNG